MLHAPCSYHAPRKCHGRSPQSIGSLEGSTSIHPFCSFEVTARSRIITIGSERKSYESRKFGKSEIWWFAPSLCLSFQDRLKEPSSFRNERGAVSAGIRPVRIRRFLFCPPRQGTLHRDAARIHVDMYGGFEFLSFFEVFSWVFNGSWFRVGECSFNKKAHSKNRTGVRLSGNKVVEKLNKFGSLARVGMLRWRCRSRLTLWACTKC